MRIIRFVLMFLDMWNTPIDPDIRDIRLCQLRPDYRTCGEGRSGRSCSMCGHDRFFLVSTIERVTTMATILMDLHFLLLAAFSLVSGIIIVMPRLRDDMNRWYGTVMMVVPDVRALPVFRVSTIERVTMKTTREMLETVLGRVQFLLDKHVAGVVTSAQVDEVALVMRNLRHELVMADYELYKLCDECDVGCSHDGRARCAGTTDFSGCPIANDWSSYAEYDGKSSG